MEANSQFDLSLPLADIIAAKISYHRSQIAFHESQIADLEMHLKKDVDGFTKMLLEKLNHAESTGVTHIKTNGAKISGVPAHLLSPEAKEISQKTVRPIVVEFLSQNEGKYTTSEIFNGLKIAKPEMEDYRREWIAAISSTMNTLSTYGRAIAYETGVGRIKKYELKKNN